MPSSSSRRVHEVLKEIGVSGKPEMLLLNKIDTEEGEAAYPGLANAASRRDSRSAQNRRTGMKEIDGGGPQSLSAERRWM